MNERINLFFEQINSSKKIYWILFIVLISLACLSTFICLNFGPAENWDESIYAISAYEMIKRGNYFVNTWHFIPDYSNTKPVLAFWPIVLSFKIFGFNLFAVRFMSAFLFIAMIVIVAIYFKKRFNNVISLTSVACFISCVQIFLLDHGFRYGDCEPFYVFVSMMFLIFVIETKYHKWAYIPAFFCASLGFLTKSFHALILVVALIAFYIMTRDYKHLKWWVYASSFFAYILPIFLWGVARYQYDQFTFFTAMFTDSAKHITSVMTSAGAVGWVVLTIVANPCFVMMFIIGVCCLIKDWKTIGLKNTLNKIGKNFNYKNYEENHVVLICTLIILSTLIIYLIPATVFSWYAYFASSTLCIIFPIFIYNFAQKHKNNIHIKTLPSLALAICTTAILVLHSIPKSIGGAEALIMKYHSISPNTSEIFYMEDSCTEGNNEIQGWNSFNREHNVLYRIEVEYNWEISTGNIDDFINSEEKSAVLIIKENSDRLQEIKDLGYKTVSDNIEYERYGYYLYSNGI